MCNEFKKNEKLNSELVSSCELNEETDIQAMLMDFLQIKSNNARIENKYHNSLKALKLFVNPN